MRRYYVFFEMSSFLLFRHSFRLGVGEDFIASGLCSSFFCVLGCCFSNDDKAAVFETSSMETGRERLCRVFELYFWSVAGESCANAKSKESSGPERSCIVSSESLQIVRSCTLWLMSSFSASYFITNSSSFGLAGGDLSSSELTRLVFLRNLSTACLYAS